MSVKAKENRLFDLTLTGWLSLDFVNTLEWRTSKFPRELLISYNDLVRWAQHTQVLSRQEAQELRSEATLYPAKAQAILEQAKELREAIFRIFSAIAARQIPEESDVSILNKWLSKTLSHLSLKSSKKGFRWDWIDKSKRLERVLWEIVRATGDTLVDAQVVEKLRECAGEGCGWLFVDESRNKSRRWCAMKICGNRAKARRHYKQIKTATPK